MCTISRKCEYYKKNSLLKFKSKNEIDIMKKLKKVFDPKNILNPGKIFDA